MLGDAAADHDHIGIENVHEGRAHGADCHPGVRENVGARRVAVVGGACQQGGVDRLATGGELREARRTATVEQCPAIACQGGAGPDRLHVADATTATTWAIELDDEMAVSPAVPSGPMTGRPSTMRPPPMPVETVT